MDQPTLPDDPKDFHDRIDFIFVKACSVIGQVVGESKTNADLVLLLGLRTTCAVVAAWKSIPRNSKRPTVSKSIQPPLDASG